MLSFFPRDVLDEILNLIESVSEDFPSYSLPYMGITPCWSCDLDHLKRFPLPQHLQTLHKIRLQLAIQTTVDLCTRFLAKFSKIFQKSYFFFFFLFSHICLCRKNVKANSMSLTSELGSTRVPSAAYQILRPFVSWFRRRSVKVPRRYFYRRSSM